MSIVETRAITGGVDTHADTHVAAALDPVGGLLGVREFPVTAAGYSGLLGWLGEFGTVCLVGIEGTGSYGAAWPATCPPPASGWSGRPLRPAGPPPPGEIRPAGCCQRGPGGPVRQSPRRAQRTRRRGGGGPRADGR